jgi:hypothetical protein
VYKEIPLTEDPRWAEYGAASPEEYAHWSLRSCGVVCIKMVADGLTLEAPRPVMAWVNEGLMIDGYRTDMRNDRPVEIGWKHVALAALAEMHRLHAEMVADFTPDDILECIWYDRALIASVSSELGEDGPITRNNGHLVVVFGVETDKQRKVQTVILHNPSGRTPELQAGARIPIERFMQAFSGRGIMIGYTPWRLPLD